MTYTSVAQILRELPNTAAVSPCCATHPAAPAISCCHVCGKPLCGDCAPISTRSAECASCRQPLKTRLRQLRALLAPSLPGLWALIGLSLVAYVLFTAHRFSVFENREPKGSRERTDRTNLYLTKVDRSDFYAEALSNKGRRDLAQRRYQMALSAIRQVLANLQETEYWKDLSGEERLETEAGLHLALARFLLRTGRRSEARSQLDCVLQLQPPPPLLRLTRFQQAETWENENPPEALRLYRESQGRNREDAAPPDSHDHLIKAASLNPITRAFYLKACRLTGRYDPAEAQARIVACHERMGERLQAEVAYRELLERYPFSEQAEALKKTRGEPKAGNPPARAPAPVPGNVPDKDEEKITIIPLGE